MKTNAMRILDSAGIPYEVRSYAWDDAHIDAMSVAQQLGADPLQVCKTIVVRGSDNQIRVMCIPGPMEINMKKARALLGIGELSLVRQDELRRLTGYIRGGVSPLGMIHPYPLYLEETIQLLDTMIVSAGQRGLQLCLAPADLMRVGGGTWADLGCM
jgi:Cys-tRNA(Pro)/Cys-tRNA(Cys) deacylase